MRPDKSAFPWIIAALTSVQAVLLGGSFGLVRMLNLWEKHCDKQEPPQR